jgi:hypothetical protein
MISSRILTIFCGVWLMSPFSWNLFKTLQLDVLVADLNLVI